MTVAQLITLLYKQPPTLNVVMARDAEGNGFSGLLEIGRADYPDDVDLYPHGEFPPEGTECVILWPSN